LRLEIGDTPVVIAHADPTQRDLVDEIVRRCGAGRWASIDTGDLHRILSRARAALSVSGTILIDLLQHRLPAVVVYRLTNRASAWLAPEILTVPWFSSVNLLAAREVYPEFSFAGEGPVDEIEAALERCYGDRAWREQCIQGLDLVSQRLGPSGAADRAAFEILDLIGALRSPNP
jgi:lipid-A-disaccharide synthase